MYCGSGTAVLNFAQFFSKFLKISQRVSSCWTREIVNVSQISSMLSGANALSALKNEYILSAWQV